jgi:uncharacterized integral membrane protein
MSKRSATRAAPPPGAAPQPGAGIGGAQGQPLPPAASQPQQPAAPQHAAQPTPEPAPTYAQPVRPADHPPTRLSAAWVGAIIAAVLLVLLLVFILQNLQRINVSFLGIHAHLPLGVALLLSGAVGVLLVAVPGTGRIMQLRKRARDAKAELEHATAAAGGPQPPQH